LLQGTVSKSYEMLLKQNIKIHCAMEKVGKNCCIFFEFTIGLKHNKKEIKR